MWRISPKVVVVALALSALGTGCATNEGSEHRQDLLVDEGFQVCPVVTPSQRWLVSNLPVDRVSTVVRDGQVYYVFPDAAKDTLYVGNEKQYLNYMLKAQEQGYGTDAWSAEFNNWDPDEQ